MPRTEQTSSPTWSQTLEQANEKHSLRCKTSFLFRKDYKCCPSKAYNQKKGTRVIQVQAMCAQQLIERIMIMVNVNIPPCWVSINLIDNNNSIFKQFVCKSGSRLFHFVSIRQVVGCIIHFLHSFHSRFISFLVSHQIMNDLFVAWATRSNHLLFRSLSFI